MHRLNPLSRFEKIGAVNPDPVKDIYEIYESKLQTNTPDIPHISDIVITDLQQLYLKAYHNHEEMTNLKRQLDRENFKKSIMYNNRIRRLYKSTALMTKKFISFNRFLKEIRDKKNHAFNQMNKQTEIQEKLTKKIKKLNWENKELRTFRSVLEKTNEEYEKYETVLQDVVNVSPLYGSISDVVNHCDALMVAKSEMKQMIHNKNIEIKEFRVTFINIARSAAVEVDAMRREIDNSYREYEDAKEEAKKWTQRLDAARDFVVEKDFTHHMVHEAITSIYRMLCKRRHISPSFQLPMELVLLFIGEEIHILKHVIDTCNDKRKSEKRGLITRNNAIKA